MEPYIQRLYIAAIPNHQVPVPQDPIPEEPEEPEE
jgi:hypothetical protein